MSTALLVRRAALVICFLLGLALPLRTASADGNSFCDAKLISGDQFFNELKEVSVAVNIDPLIAKIVPADELRKKVTDLLASYQIKVRDQAPVTLFVEVEDSPRDIKRTMTYSDGSRDEEVFHWHVIYCEMALFVRATALRNGKFHLLAASTMNSANIFTVQEVSGLGKVLVGDHFAEELKQKLDLNLADRMKFFATPGPAAAPDPWPVGGWSDQQKASVNEAYTAFINSDPKIEKRPIDGLDTAPELKLKSDIHVEGVAEDPSWKKLWQSECENLGLVKPANPPALLIRHYFGCEVFHHPAFQSFDDMVDEITFRESNLVFNFNGRLVRKQASIFSYHRSMVAGQDDLHSVTDNYLLRSLKEFEANLRAGDQPLPAMEAPSVSQPKDITKQVALGMNFARIEPGSFLMGSPETEEDRAKDETQHRVTLTKPYYMAAHDVTRAQFAAFVDQTGYKTDAEKADSDETWRHNKVFEQEETHPVVQVSWNDAVAFIAWLSKRDHKTYRLPTEAEWEYACRAGTTTPFNTGATISADLANYNGNFVYGAGAKGVNRETTTPVGSFPANKWGLYDMHGNAWQWCSDVYGDYAASAVNDPSGPAEGPWRVLRGGSYVYAPLTCRSASRYHNVPEIHYNDCGFRVVLASP